MNTPAHLLIGAALFSRRNTALLLAALLGGLLPDLSLYLMAGVSIFLLNIPPETVFDQLYFTDSWQLVFSIDNSLIIWSLALAIALALNKPVFIAMCAAGVLHLLCDFALHHDDARAHFWPISTWRFESPLSYWDSNHHAWVVAPLEGVIAAVAVVYLLYSQWHVALRVFLLLLLVAEIAVLYSWLKYF